MEGAFSKTALQKFGTCSGLRPWLPDDKPKSCNADRRVLQRGATNVWFSITRSALSIPPWSERAFRALDRHWTIVRAVPPDILPLVLNNLNLGDDEFSVEDLVAAVLERLRDDEATAAKASIEEEEYEALIRNRPERHRDQTFVCVPAKDVDPSLHQWLPLVQQVRRLRLVQALTGFTRLRSDNGATERVGALTETAVDWLPAIEINGEGVFLQLEGEALTEWEHRPTVVRRVATLAGRYAESCLRLGAPLAVAVTPRLVLAHSIAHALIDQWSLEAGYPTAALSERLYVGDRMAGILIYTATSDSAGSLGGLVSMTEQSRLETSLAEALDRASWCGQDPLCIESDSHGVDALNLAACHSCLLVPETCCTHANTFLDRALLVGTDEEPELAYFRAMIGR